MDFVRRQCALRGQLDDLRVDALLITHLPNIRYLCGFTGSAGVLIVHPGKPVFFTDGRYTEQAREEVKGARVVIAKGAPLTFAAQWAQAQGFRNVGLEAQHTTLAARTVGKRTLSAKMRVREISGAIEKLRLRKDEQEITVIREAVNLGASLLDAALIAAAEFPYFYALIGDRNPKVAPSARERGERHLL